MSTESEASRRVRIAVSGAYPRFDGRLRSIDLPSPTITASPGSVGLVYQTQPGFLGLARYDCMVEAIEACREVDEVKEIRDKVRALEVYHSQAKNTLAERLCAEIRVRAEYRAGELLVETRRDGERDAGTGGDRKSRSPDSTVKTLKDLGITKSQSSFWQRLCKTIPKEELDTWLGAVPWPSGKAILRAATPPSATTIRTAARVNAHAETRPQPAGVAEQVFTKLDAAVFLMEGADPASIATGMPDAMLRRAEEIVAVLRDLLAAIEAEARSRKFSE